MTSIVSPGFTLYRPVRLRELRDRDQALGLVPEIDDYFLVGDLKDVALQHLAFSGRGEVAVIIEHLRIVPLGGRKLRLNVLIVLIAGHTTNLRVRSASSTVRNGELPAGKSSRL